MTFFGPRAAREPPHHPPERCMDLLCGVIRRPPERGILSPTHVPILNTPKPDRQTEIHNSIFPKHTTENWRTYNQEPTGKDYRGEILESESHVTLSRRKVWRISRRAPGQSLPSNPRALLSVNMFVCRNASDPPLPDRETVAAPQRARTPWELGSWVQPN